MSGTNSVNAASACQKAPLKEGIKLLLSGWNGLQMAVKTNGAATTSSRSHSNWPPISYIYCLSQSKRFASACTAHLY
ncbi:hypothetical protein SLA2020_330960 [Shorea laevis]